MVIISRCQHLLAPTLTIAGLFLLIAARPLSGLSPRGDLALSDIYNLGAWAACLALLIGYYIYSGLSSKTIKRFLLVMAVFALGVFPLESANVDITAQSISVLGITMFILGATLWRVSHPLFARLGNIIALNRRITAPSYIAIIYTAFLAIALALSWHCFRFIPGYVDSVAQYVHGKFIASGQLYGISPPMRHFYPVWMMVNNGKWYGQYQPLHEFIMGFGHIIGAPWLINPVEGALTAVVIYILARRIFDEQTARLAGILSVGCIFMLFISAEFMNHSTALLLTTLMVYFYVEMLEDISVDGKNARWWGLASGLSLGGVFLTRPLDAIGVGLPFFIYSLVLLKRDFRRYLNPLYIMGVGSMACFIFDLWYNIQTTGSALLFPSGAYHGGDNISAMGFSDSTSIATILYKTQNEWVRLNRQMFELWLPSTFFFMLFCLLPVKNRYQRLLLCMIASHTIFNMANQYHSSVFGPRYLYETASAIVIFSAAGIIRIPLLLKTFGVSLPDQSATQGIIAFAVITAFIVGWSWNLAPLINGYTHFFDNHPEFYSSMLRQSEKPALIFIGRGADDKEAKYKWINFTNPPNESSDVIFAIDRDDSADRSLMQRYPSRHAYVELGGALIPFDVIESGKFNKVP